MEFGEELQSTEACFHLQDLFLVEIMFYVQPPPLVLVQGGHGESELTLTVTCLLTGRD